MNEKMTMAKTPKILTFESLAMSFEKMNGNIKVAPMTFREAELQ